jgi:hypothetical protein
VVEHPTNNSQQSSEPKKPKKRGGKRPGAGAPKGNMNALKHGRYSKQFAEAGSLVAASPKIRDALIALGERHDFKRRKAEEIAVDLFGHIMRHAADVAAGRTKKSFLPEDLQSLS